MKDYKNFTYIKSRSLDKELAFPKGYQIKEVSVHGGVKYSMEEINIMYSAVRTVTEPIHLVKEVFGGEIVQCQ